MSYSCADFTNDVVNRLIELGRIDPNLGNEEDLEAVAEKLIEALESKPRVVIIIDGGALQQVIADQAVDFRLIDYDVMALAEAHIVQVPNDDGKWEPGYVVDMPVDLSKELTAQLMALPTSAEHSALAKLTEDDDD